MVPKGQVSLDITSAAPVPSVSVADHILKIEWAYKRINELDGVIADFLSPKLKPYTIGVKINPQTREKIYYAERVSAIPTDVPLLAGDAIQNLRSALDYLACSLVRANGGTVSERTGFPIFKNVPTSKLNKAAFAGKIEGMRNEAKDIIRATKPYKGGNDALWRIHRLNVIDKHQMLQTVGMAIGRFNIGQHLRATRTGRLAQATDVWISPSISPSRILLVKQGQELFVDPADAKINENPDVEFQVALNEVGLCEGEPLILVLKQSLNLVRGLLPNFSKFL